MDITINSNHNLALQRLMTWLSPAFPIGAFAYSGGLETAIAQGEITNLQQLHDWLIGTLTRGSGSSDAIIVAEAHRAGCDAAEFQQIADFCHAFTPSSQRISEMNNLGDAFVKAAAAWPTPALQLLPRPCPYPLAVGAIAGDHDIPMLNTLIAFLTAYTHSQISVAVRLVPLGQNDGLRVLADLETTIAAIAGETSSKSRDDITTISYAADIAAMQHETLNSRIFRS